jgi:lipopolysaccharide cholinephosphotransferase
VKAWAYPFNKIRLKRISKLYNSLFLKYPYEEAEYVSILTCDTQKRVILPKAETSKFLKIPFEGFMFDVISNYEDFLEQRYGNYMQLPPECERKTHGLKVWRNPEV